MCQLSCSKHWLKGEFLSSSPFPTAVFSRLSFLSPHAPSKPNSRQKAPETTFFWWISSIRFTPSNQCWGEILLTSVYNVLFTLATPEPAWFIWIKNASAVSASLPSGWKGYSKAAGWSLLQLSPQILLSQSCFSAEWSGSTWSNCLHLKYSWRSTWENMNRGGKISNYSGNYCISWREWPLIWVILS